MKLNLSCLLLCLLLISQLTNKAENKLLLCTAYDANGEYSGDYSSWNIQKTGNYMYLFYTSDKPVNDTLFITINKTFNRKDTNFYLFDHYYLIPDSSKKFAVNKYTFSKPGNYQLRVFDRKSEELLGMYTAFIGYNEDQYNEVFFTDTWYYKETSIFFCDSISEDMPIGKREVFNYDSNRNKITLYIENANKKPLKTNNVFIKVYDKENRKLILSDSYSLNGNWFWTYINIFLEEKGKYTLELYNADDVFINAADLEIK